MSLGHVLSAVVAVVFVLLIVWGRREDDE